MCYLRERALPHCLSLPQGPALLPDNYDQVTRIAERDEVPLLRDIKMDEFNVLVEELLYLGYLEELSEQEKNSWTVRRRVLTSCQTHGRS